MVSRAGNWREREGDPPIKLSDSTSMRAIFIFFFEHVSKILSDEVVLLFRNTAKYFILASKYLPT